MLVPSDLVQVMAGQVRYPVLCIYDAVTAGAHHAGVALDGRHKILVILPPPIIAQIYAGQVGIPFAANATSPGPIWEPLPDGRQVALLEVASLQVFQGPPPPGYPLNLPMVSPADVQAIQAPPQPALPAPVAPTPATHASPFSKQWTPPDVLQPPPLPPPNGLPFGSPLVPPLIPPSLLPPHHLVSPLPASMEISPELPELVPPEMITSFAPPPPLSFAIPSSTPPADVEGTQLVLPPGVLSLDTITSDGVLSPLLARIFSADEFPRAVSRGGFVFGMVLSGGGTVRVRIAAFGDDAKELHQRFVSKELARNTLIVIHNAYAKEAPKTPYGWGRPWELSIRTKVTTIVTAPPNAALPPDSGSEWPYYPIQTALQQQPGSIINLAGIVQSEGYLVPARGTVSSRREITICDQGNQEVRVTFWGLIAQSFPTGLQNHPIGIVAVKYDGSNFSSTEMTFFSDTLPFVIAVTDFLPDDAVVKRAAAFHVPWVPETTLAENFRAPLAPGATATAAATATLLGLTVESGTRLTYPGCPACHRKLTNEFQCPQCHTIVPDEAILSIYNFQVRFGDYTGVVVMKVIFNELIGNTLTGYTAKEVYDLERSDAVATLHLNIARLAWTPFHVLYRRAAKEVGGVIHEDVTILDLRPVDYDIDGMAIATQLGWTAPGTTSGWMPKE